MTVEGPPVSERNWACKHLTALVRTFPSCSASGNNSLARGQLTGFTGGHQPPGAKVENEHVNIEEWQRRTGVDTVCQDTVIEDCWSDGDRSEGEEENPDGEGCNTSKSPFNLVYKIPCDNHGLSYLLKPQKDGSLPLASSPDPPSATPELLTLQQELERDPEAQMLAASTLGCIIRRCLFRDGKGGVHLSNYGQARLEGSVFRGLNYAVRCIQNSTVNKIIIMFFRLMESLECKLTYLKTIEVQWLFFLGSIYWEYQVKEVAQIMSSSRPVLLDLPLLLSDLLQIVMLRNEVCECRASGVSLRLSAQGLIAENNIHSNGEAGLDIRKGANPIIVVIAAPLSIEVRP